MSFQDKSGNDRQQLRLDARIAIIRKKIGEAEAEISGLDQRKAQIRAATDAAAGWPYSKFAKNQAKRILCEAYESYRYVLEDAVDGVGPKHKADALKVFEYIRTRWGRKKAKTGIQIPIAKLQEALAPSGVLEASVSTVEKALRLCKLIGIVEVLKTKGNPKIARSYIPVIPDDYWYWLDPPESAF